MTAREQAEELKQQAIALLLKEREQIDVELKALGYGQEKAALGKRRGRPPKQAPENPIEPSPPPSHSENSL